MERAEKRPSSWESSFMEMMRDPARRGPLQPYLQIDPDTNALVESPQPLAVNTEHLEGELVVMNAEVAQAAFDRAWEKYVPIAVENERANNAAYESLRRQGKLSPR